MIQFLAIHDDHGGTFLETSPEAVQFALVNEMSLKYYRIDLDEFQVPTLVPITKPEEVSCS